MKRNYIYDGTRDEYNQFRAGYRAYEKDGKVVVEYLTNRQGDCDKTWVVDFEYFHSLGGFDIQDKCHAVSMNCEPAKKSKPIQ